MMAFSAFFLVLTGTFPKQSAYFPRFFTLTLIALSAFIVWGGFKKSARLGQGTAAETDERPITRRELALPMAGIAVMVCYIAAIPLLGFFVSTGLFMLAGMWLLKIRSIPMMLLSTLGLEAFIYLLFIVQLKLNMPSGLLI